MRSKNLSVKIPTAGATLDCFECNSWEDPRCHDPFNYSIYKEEMPETKACEGCCVKMVQFIGTGKKDSLVPVTVTVPLLIAMIYN